MAVSNITNAQLMAALRKHAGVYVLAAQELDTSRQNVWQRVNRSPELQAFVAQIEEEVLDAAEAVVKSSILARDKQMTRWYLERKGKGRGWSTRVEHTGANGAPLPAGGAGVSVSVSLSYIDPKEDVL